MHYLTEVCGTDVALKRYRMTISDAKFCHRIFGPLAVVLWICFPNPAVGSEAIDHPGLPSFGLSNSLPSRIGVPTEIRFTVPVDGQTSLVVLDIHGQIVAKLIDGNQSAGSHNILWSAMTMSGTAIPDGVYFVRLQAGDYTDIRKVIVVR